MKILKSTITNLRGFDDLISKVFECAEANQKQVRPTASELPYFTSHQRQCT